MGQGRSPRSEHLKQRMPRCPAVEACRVAGKPLTTFVAVYHREACICAGKLWGSEMGGLSDVRGSIRRGSTRGVKLRRFKSRGSNSGGSSRRGRIVLQRRIRVSRPSAKPIVCCSPSGQTLQLPLRATHGRAQVGGNACRGCSRRATSALLAPVSANIGATDIPRCGERDSAIYGPRRRMEGLAR